MFPPHIAYFLCKKSCAALLGHRIRGDRSNGTLGFIGNLQRACRVVSRCLHARSESSPAHRITNSTPPLYPSGNLTMFGAAERRTSCWELVRAHNKSTESGSAPDTRDQQQSTHGEQPLCCSSSQQSRVAVLLPLPSFVPITPAPSRTHDSAVRSFLRATVKPLDTPLQTGVAGSKAGNDYWCGRRTYLRWFAGGGGGGGIRKAFTYRSSPDEGPKGRREIR